MNPATMRLPLHLAGLLLGLLVLEGCADSERAAYIDTLGTAGSDSGAVDLCAAPREGCPCETPGSTVACGDVETKVDEYVSCSEGSRLCKSSGTWGNCSGSGAVRKTAASSGSRTLALGSAANCSAELRKCDPLCREVVDTGTGLTNLNEGLCSSSLGLTLCGQCGYAQATSTLTYSQLPTAPTNWQILSKGCGGDWQCTMDTHCVGGNCTAYADTCVNSGESPADLTLGRPCVGALDPASTYHIPVCNRGSRDTLSGGKIRIGVYSTATGHGCVPIAATDPPDKGYIEFELSNAPGRSIAPGRCVDVNAGNSVAVGLDLAGNRLLYVNYDGRVSDWNGCNNTNVFISPSTNSPASQCAPCTTLTCAQRNANTTLRGTIYDPAGRTVIPNATVYVPNSEVAQLLTASTVTCDTCESLISGTPIATTKADATGAFTLTNVPSDVPFPLVIQTGRWRRQFTVDPVPEGQIRFVGSCAALTDPAGNASGTCAVTAADTKDSVSATNHLRLPRTQRRCSAPNNCAGEGDIPRIALIMGDADPMQCLLRRIGVAKSEMTVPGGSGRVHLFNHNGMQMTGAGAQNGFGDGGLLSDKAKLSSYAALLAPCDYEHNKEWGSTVAKSYSSSAYRSGPTYNSPPNPTANETERGNVKDYVDAGGRLFTSHWLSMDFVHLNYSAPPLPKKSSIADERVSMLSPYSPTDSFAASASNAGLKWEYQAPAAYNTAAPVVHLFGRPIEAAYNTSDTGAYPYFNYTIRDSDLSTWATAAQASTTSGLLQFKSWSSLIHSVRPALGVTALATGNSTNASSLFTGTSAASTWKVPVPVGHSACVMGSVGAGCDNSRLWGDDHVALLQFDTPISATAADKCGRVVVAQSHVTKHHCTMPSGITPSDCAATNTDGGPCACMRLNSTTSNGWLRGCGDDAPDSDPSALYPLSSEELAFEYLLFSTTQCLGAVVPPTQDATLSPSTFRRTFQSNCGADEQVVWQIYSLQATIPAGTKISINAATADTEVDLSSAKSAFVTNLTQSTTGWTSSDHTLDYYFRNSLTPKDASRKWLAVDLTLTPNGVAAPTVLDWRVVFNCAQNQ